MFRRETFSIFIRRLTLFLSIFFGLLPAVSVRGFDNSKKVKIYGYFMSIILLSSMIYSMYESAVNGKEYQVYFSTMLRLILDSITGALRMGSLLLAMLRNIFRRDPLFRIFQKIHKLERHFHNKYKKKYEKFNCPGYDSSVIWLGIIRILETFSIIYAFGSYAADPKKAISTIVCLIIFLQNILMLIFNQFYYAILFIYRSISMLNQRVCEMLDEIDEHSSSMSIYCLTCQAFKHQEQRNKSKQHKKRVWMQRLCDMADEIDEMAIIYKRLMYIADELIRYYQWPLLLATITYLSINVEHMYYSVEHFASLHHSDAATIYSFANALQVSFINLLDFWWSIEPCELMKQAAIDTRVTLRRFCDYKDLDVRLDQSVDNLMMLSRTSSMRVRLCGLIDIEHATACQVFVTSFAFLIVLIQFDYDHLRTGRT